MVEAQPTQIKTHPSYDDASDQYVSAQDMAALMERIHKHAVRAEILEETNQRRKARNRDKNKAARRARRANRNR